MTRFPAYFNVFTLILFICCTLLFSCQKELEPSGYQICLPETIEVFEDNNAIAAESYTYVYDPVTLWPKTITISLPGASFNKILDIVVDVNTISLGTTGYIEMDLSKRITHLAVKEAYPGAEKGDYFYGYDGLGFLAERLFDNGSTLIERAVFYNNGTEIDSLSITYENDPDKLFGNILYQSAGSGSGENLLPYTDIFPELLPFAYLIKLGRVSLDIPEQMKVLYESPGLPGASLKFQYADYQFNADKMLTGFSSTLGITGLPDYKRKFGITYICN